MQRPPFDEVAMRRARRAAEQGPQADLDPRVEALVYELIGRVADKWTMIILELLHEHDELRFTKLSRQVPGSARRC